METEASTSTNSEERESVAADVYTTVSSPVYSRAFSQEWRCGTGYGGEALPVVPSQARCIPQPPWLTALLVGEVLPAPLVVLWRCTAIDITRHTSARYSPHPPEPELIPLHPRTSITSRRALRWSAGPAQLELAPTARHPRPSSFILLAGPFPPTSMAFDWEGPPLAARDNPQVRPLQESTCTWLRGGSAMYIMHPFPTNGLER